MSAGPFRNGDVIRIAGVPLRQDQLSYEYRVTGARQDSDGAWTLSLELDPPAPVVEHHPADARCFYCATDAELSAAVAGRPHRDILGSPAEACPTWEDNPA